MQFYHHATLGINHLTTWACVTISLHAQPPHAPARRSFAFLEVGFSFQPPFAADRCRPSADDLYEQQREWFGVMVDWSELVGDAGEFIEHGDPLSGHVGRRLDHHAGHGSQLCAQCADHLEQRCVRDELHGRRVRVQ